MRSAPALVASVGAAAMLLALAGCTPPAVHVPASPSASATPVFASDAEALKAAEAAYAAYLKVSDQIGQDGGNGRDRFATVVTTAWLPTELESAGELQKSGTHQTGVTGHSALTLQQYSSSRGSATVVAYSCLDLSQTRIFDSSDVDITPAGRTTSVSIEVTFVSDPAKANRLLVDSNEPWSGSSFC